MSYEVIYKLKPVSEVEPDWWRLRWRPIWKHTFSIYILKSFGRNFGFRTYSCDANNGWNRSYRHQFLEIEGFGYRITTWIRWRFIVHKDGPSDVADSDKRPLDLTND